MSLYGAMQNQNEDVAKLIKEDEFDTRRLLVLNSYDRDDVYNTTSSRYQVTLQRAVKIKKIRLESAVIPLACPVLSDTDSLGNLVALQVAFQEQAGGGELTVDIPLKINYSASAFATDMSALMTAASANALTYTVTYDSEKMKLTFASTGNFRFNWNSTPYPSECMGFGRVNTPTAYSNSITSTGIVYFSQDPLIGCKIHGLGDCSTDASGASQTFVLSVSSPPGTVYDFRANSQYNMWLSFPTEPQVRTITVSFWRHAKGRLLYMGGCDNQLILSYIPADGYQ